jgi:hypothetical protein
LRVIQSDEIFWQLFWFEWFGDGGSTDWADGEPLLLNFDQTLLTESVTTVEISGDTIFGVEVLVTRRAVHN